MKRIPNAFAMALLAGLCALAGSARAQGRPGAEPVGGERVQMTAEQLKEMLEEAGLKKTGEHTWQLAKVALDTEKGTVRFPAKVMAEFPEQMELVACVPEGKTYETMLVMDARAIHVNLALLLLGMKPGRNPALKYADDDPTGKLPKADLARVLVEWTPKAEGEEPAQPRRERAEWFLKDAESGERLKPAEFAFIGSRWLKGGLAADLHGTVIALYQDPGTVLELAHERALTHPWSLADMERLPPTGTPVEVVIEYVKPEPVKPEAGDAERTQEVEEK